MECEVCGHESDEAFEVVRHVGRHTFDTFECAIYAMAPRCDRCGVRVIGHPVERDDHTYCCGHCAEAGPSRGAGSGGEETSAGDEEDEDEDGDEDDEDDDEDEDEGQEEGGGEDQDGELERLDQRIDQARQGADDLLTSPEDEVDQEEAEVESEAEVGEGEEERAKGDGDGEDEEDEDEEEGS